ncbi:hypothetical protein [Pseudomonas xantholysinigenes]|uniref:Uncharacterized protein n=1 Tax=Pseudomonas xantholysinigenes TaxID=2745490 RepID=A0A9E6PV77_9PSED|nr:hypothetical protein [Pseudomonas xantholysinigenes]QXI37338.1 hypothetical protein HU772_018620 [Pseudomonas xantholysinigenes]
MSAVLAYRDICVIDNAISADEQRQLGELLSGAIWQYGWSQSYGPLERPCWHSFIAGTRRDEGEDCEAELRARPYWGVLAECWARIIALGDGTEPTPDSTGVNSGAVSLPGGGASGQGAYGSGPAVIYPHAPCREISYPRVDIGPIEWVNPRQTYFGRDRYH